MRFESTAGSRVLVDLRATGFLQAIAHNPTLVAHPEPFAVDVAWKEGGAGGGGEARAQAGAEGGSREEALAGDVPIDVRCPVSAIQPPADLSPADRAKMLENLRGPDVLDAARFPTIDFRGRYEGTERSGSLSGELTVRGRTCPIVMPIAVARRGAEMEVEGAWEGKLSALGIKPFRALLGALRLDDWIRLRLKVSLAHH